LKKLLSFFRNRFYRAMGWKKRGSKRDRNGKQSPDEGNRVSTFYSFRYMKSSRKISNTPLSREFKDRTQVIGNIQDLVGNHLNQQINAEFFKMQSAGREDIDVKMLGDGRPAVIQFVRPKVLTLIQEDLDKLQKEFNLLKNGVQISNLKTTERKMMSLMNQVAQDKQKTYLARCYSVEPVSCEELQKNLVDKGEITIYQTTPVRVVMSRSLILRTRIVCFESFSIEDNPHYFNLTIRTSAGVYIKELVHGDRGRTSPSVQEALGKKCVIVTLDVVNVHCVLPDLSVKSEGNHSQTDDKRKKTSHSDVPCS